MNSEFYAGLFQAAKEGDPGCMTITSRVAQIFFHCMGGTLLVIYKMCLTVYIHVGGDDR